LETLPETFGNLSSLEEFVLTETYNHPSFEEFYKAKGSWFTHLPESFGNLSSLIYFHVSDTRITRLPESFVKLSSLRELHIQEAITCDFYFPAGMKNMTGLIDFSISSLDYVPDFVGELKNLRILDISHNKLEVLPEFIGKLTKLKSLNLHSTWITGLPDWIANLKKLEHLDISHNPISEFPEVVKKLPKLKDYWGVGKEELTDNSEQLTEKSE
jgi:Leucine-rich repeat (LRR) protein